VRSANKPSKMAMKFIDKFFNIHSNNKKETNDVSVPTLLSENYDIIAHIGAPKTGTSAIQYFLLNNCKLLSKFGFFYPEHGVDTNNVSGGHTELGSHFLSDNRIEAENVFNRYISNAKNKKKCLLLSAESFFNHPKALKHVTSNYKTKIIAYFRDPIESLISMYNQAVKRHFCIETINRFIKNSLNSDQRSLSGKIFDTWVDLFGRENFLLLPYHENSFPENSIEFSFLNALGINHSAWENFSLSNSPTNRSYTTAALELKRLFNQVLDRNENRINNRIDWCLQAYSDKFPEEKGPPVKLIESDLYESLKEKFECTNQEIKSKYFSEVPSGFLDYDKNYKTTERGTEFIDFHLPPPLNEVLFETFKNDKDLVVHVKKKLIKKLSDEKRNYSILKLAELLKMEKEDIDSWSNTPFSKRQIDIITDPKSGKPDILRELAVALESMGNYQNAQRVINRAIELRPKGPFLIKLRNRLKRKIGPKR